MCGASIVGGIVAGGLGLLKNKSAKKAAEKQDGMIYEMHTESLNELRRQFDQSVELLRPRIQAGDEALKAQLDMIRKGPADYGEGFETSPGYEFAKSEAIGAYDASAAKRGNLLSGGAQKELATYVGNALAAPEYQRNWERNRAEALDYTDNVNRLSDSGGAAAGAVAGAGQDYAQSVAALNTRTAESRANVVGTKQNADNDLYDTIGGIAGDILGGSG